MITCETNRSIVNDPRSDAAGTAASLGVDGFLLYRLSMVSRRLSDALQAYYGPRHGLQRAEWRMLALIGEQPVCTAADLVRRASMDAVAVHRAVGRLVARGLVARAASASDRRVKPLRLSAAGRRVYRDVVPAALGLERQVLKSLSPTEARSLQSALDKLMGMRFDARPDERGS